MSRPKDKPVQTRTKPELRTKIYLHDDMVGMGKIALLRKIGETGSISAAAKSMGVGYRRAWFLLDSLQACFKAPLFTTARGGPGKGGAHLTEAGAELIARYDGFQASLDDTAAPFLDWLAQRQAAPKTP